MRINKYIAKSLGVSRREADEMIISGQVLFNGATASLGQVVSEGDQIVASGKELVLADEMYLLMNKPVGYVCSRSRQGSPTIYELLDEKYKGLKTVGRLDKDSSGLILLTNDGDYAHKLTHPKYSKEKIYSVELDKRLSQREIQSIKNGVDLKDGQSKFGIKHTEDNTYQVTLKEGRNRQIRRTFAAIERTVLKLHRTKFGPYQFDELEPGQTREVGRIN